MTKIPNSGSVVEDLERWVQEQNSVPLENPDKKTKAAKAALADLLPGITGPDINYSRLSSLSKQLRSDILEPNTEKRAELVTNPRNQKTSHKNKILFAGIVAVLASIAALVKPLSSYLRIVPVYAVWAAFVVGLLLIAAAIVIHKSQNQQPESRKSYEPPTTASLPTRVTYPRKLRLSPF